MGDGNQSKRPWDQRQKENGGTRIRGIDWIHPLRGNRLQNFNTVTNDDSPPVRAAAAKKLARDPNPDSGEALITATTTRTGRKSGSEHVGPKDRFR
jgi:hypothetical protein